MRFSVWLAVEGSKVQLKSGFVDVAGRQKRTGPSRTGTFDSTACGNRSLVPSARPAGNHSITGPAINWCLSGRPRSENIANASNIADSIRSGRTCSEKVARREPAFGGSAVARTCAKLHFGEKTFPAKGGAEAKT